MAFNCLSKGIYMFTNINIHIYIYIYIHVYTYIYTHVSNSTTLNETTGLLAYDTPYSVCVSSLTVISQ